MRVLSVCVRVCLVANHIKNFDFISVCPLTSVFCILTSVLCPLSKKGENGVPLAFESLSHGTIAFFSDCRKTWL